MSRPSAIPEQVASLYNICVSYNQWFLFTHSRLCFHSVGQDVGMVWSPAINATLGTVVALVLFLG